MTKILQSLAILISVAVSPLAYGAECILYEHGNRQGAAWTINGEYSTAFMRPGWNDVVTSVWIRCGYKLAIHEHIDFDGASAELYGDGWVPDSWSLIVHETDNGAWYNLGDIGWNDDISAFSCVVDDKAHCE